MTERQKNADELPISFPQLQKTRKEAERNIVGLIASVTKRNF
jgi:hypothetical protein